MQTPNSNPPRPILKLKAASKRTVTDGQTPHQRKFSKLIHKPGALWSDELRRQMQDDMNALKLR